MNITKIILIVLISMLSAFPLRHFGSNYGCYFVGIFQAVAILAITTFID